MQVDTYLYLYVVIYCVTCMLFCATNEGVTNFSPIRARNYTMIDDRDAVN